MLSRSLELALQVKVIFSPAEAHTCSGLSSITRDPEGQVTCSHANTSLYPDVHFQAIKRIEFPSPTKMSFLYLPLVSQ